jgi:hypothetical protein
MAQTQLTHDSARKLAAAHGNQAMLAHQKAMMALRANQTKMIGEPLGAQIPVPIRGPVLPASGEKE